MNATDHRRIMLVEDDAQLRRICCFCLRQTFPDCTVDEEAYGEMALNRAIETDYDLVITDMGLPGMSGRDLYIALLERKAGAAGLMPGFLFCSAVLNTRNAIAEFCEPGGNAFLEKPFAMTVMLEIVSDMLGPATHRTMDIARTGGGAL